MSFPKISRQFFNYFPRLIDIFSKNIDIFFLSLPHSNLQATFTEENSHSHTSELQSSQTDKVRSVGVFCILDLYVADEFVLEKQNRQ